MTGAPLPAGPLTAGPLTAGIELGGTKSIAVLARGPQILDRVRVATEDPETVLGGMMAALDGWQAAGAAIAGLGIASFGPLCLDPALPDFGRLTTTPKQGWAGTDLLAPFRRFGLPVALDTDVNGAALAEGRWGAAQGLSVHAYLTIGTGIGGGAVVNGRPLHGLMHPEMGHVRPASAPASGFAGICPYHGNCLEGLASGPAIAARTGRPAHEIGDDDPVWPMIADELATLIANLLLILSPQRILIGGGVGSRAVLLPHLRRATARMLGGYLAPVTPDALDRLITAPALGSDAGPLGAVALAEMAAAG
ncbi:ROK family protein [Sphingomonas changnyeongensis]|uniref:fructokinase n=2 Tax=Sphingomonas changnyeongensis TaxID=2698679 RepID=A0A7Z2NXM6_9SPHN|nr:ROK family protein [Sphingomonas changnyeongensis]